MVLVWFTTTTIRLNGIRMTLWVFAAGEPLVVAITSRFAVSFVEFTHIPYTAVTFRFPISSFCMSWIFDNLDVLWSMACPITPQNLCFPPPPPPLPRPPTTLHYYFTTMLEASVIIAIAITVRLAGGNHFPLKLHIFTLCFLQSGWWWWCVVLCLSLVRIQEKVLK